MNVIHNLESYSDCETQYDDGAMPTIDKPTRTVVILGAGASRGAQHVNPERLPPLLLDIRAALIDCLDPPYPRRLELSQLAWDFGAVADLTGASDDVEELLTYVELTRRALDHARLTEGLFRTVSKDDLVSEGGLVDRYLSKDVELPTITKVKAVAGYFWDRQAQIPSMLNFFREYLRHYLQECFLNHYCDYHASVFKFLAPSDIVCSFNYDQVADFTLDALGLLWPESFYGLPFSEVRLPSNYKRRFAVRFLKLHGSVNWSRSVTTGQVQYFLISKACPRDIAKPQGEPGIVILPQYHKRYFYDNDALYSAHVDKFATGIAEASRVILVGKTFQNADAELNALISGSCGARQRDLYLIDLNSDNREFCEFHAKLFNAAIAGTRRTLIEHYSSPFGLPQNPEIKFEPA